MRHDIPEDVTCSKVQAGYPSTQVRRERIGRLANFLFDGLGLDEVAQAVRHAHCADNSTHKCVGMCIIRADGILLSCKKCGHEFEPKED